MSEPTYRLLRCSQSEGVLVLEILESQVRSDELTADLYREFMAALTQYAPQKIVIDLNRVVLVSSRGFGAIASLHQEVVRKQGGRIALCSIRPEVQELLELMRFTDHRGLSPMVEKTGSSEGRPKTKPLFEIVTSTVDEAVQRLNALPGN